ncbi:hypothetical protein DEVEQU_01036 [Devosia equisanguinis]|uniref:DUF1028 domain-containing protein n=1 Tax=Devosia equisanguinis TaxID=2490941 RepID=A0A447I929_9HYPH|nr:DUF1028 domain-containing protein [Devosia equisanguinis]VDS03907.1 hypothetical protein DEVEQU_01036 [Devosia equisanguinis]
MTFSIVARDPKTGAFGVATATAGPMVGALVPHTRQGFGAAATQAMTNPYLAIDALGALNDLGAEQALHHALTKDDKADLRQVIIVDLDGSAVGWTGGQCIGFAGHLLGEGVAVAGNMLTGEAVLADMMDAYRDILAKSSFAAALFAALRAGAEAGGDKRGLGSVALRVHHGQAFPEIDLRVDMSDAPLASLEALLEQATHGGYADFFGTVPRR